MATRIPRLGEQARCRDFVDAWDPNLLVAGFDWSGTLHPRNLDKHVFIEEDDAGDIIGLMTITAEEDASTGIWWFFHTCIHPRLLLSLHKFIVPIFQGMGRGDNILKWSLEGQTSSFKTALKDWNIDVAQATEISPDVWRTSYDSYLLSGQKADDWQVKAERIPDIRSP